MPRGRRPKGECALSDAERQARYRARHQAEEPPPLVRYRRPLDRRARPQRWHAAVAELLALQAEYAAWYDAWERDAISGKDYLDRTVFYEPRPFSRGDFFSSVLNQSQLLQDSALGILKEIAASNQYLVGALNNEARETNEYRFRQFGLRQHFKVACSSCYLGLRKPEPAIYRRTLDILGKPPERVLFIDDRAENTEAARAAKMQAIQFKGAEPLRAELANLGVL